MRTTHKKHDLPVMAPNHILKMDQSAFEHGNENHPLPLGEWS